MQTIDDESLFIIINALRVAAARYTEDAVIAREQKQKGTATATRAFESLAAQFDKQALEASLLANKLEA